jgi:hypothetical protein
MRERKAKATSEKRSGGRIEVKMRCDEDGGKGKWSGEKDLCAKEKNGAEERDNEDPPLRRNMWLPKRFFVCHQDSSFFLDKFYPHSPHLLSFFFSASSCAT